MTNKLVLALDLGTTSTRAIVFDASGEMLAVAQKELRLVYPENGWVEQDAADLWQDAVAVMRDAIAKIGTRAADIVSIGVTNQRETVVIWDKTTGKAVYNAIVWQDRRTADACSALQAAGHEDAIRDKTGLLLDPYFSATKAAWILKHTARENDTASLLMGTVDSFVIWHLTGGRVHMTDATNASRTMLFNIKTQDWDDELCTLFGVPKHMLAKVGDCIDDYGVTDANIAGAALPIRGVAGDQQAALIGQACFAPGMVKSTYGTGCFVLMNIGDNFRPSQHRLLTTVAYRVNGRTTYAMEGAIFVAGAAVQWLRDGLRLFKSARETEGLAANAAGSHGVYLVPAFTGLGAPYWRPDARGAIVGLTRDADIGHITRAALEAQAYQTRDLMSAMADDGGHEIATLRVDGGMVANSFVCQFISDMLQTDVARPTVIETTALGAAYLAMVGAGIYKDLDEVASRWQVEKTFHPVMQSAEADRLYAGWQRAIKGVLAIAET